MLKSIETKNAPAAIGPYSQAIVLNNMVYTSGQIPINPETGSIVEGKISEQTEQVMKNLQVILEEAGASFKTVVKTMCFIQNMEDFTAFNEIYAKYFVTKPARSCVAVKELPKGSLIEVEVIACIE